VAVVYEICVFDVVTPPALSDQRLLVAVSQTLRDRVNKIDECNFLADSK